MAKQGKRSELSLKHRAEGKPVFLGVKVRAALKKRLQEIAGFEDQSLDYIVDQLLRRAVDEYAGAGSMRGLLASSGAPAASRAKDKRIASRNAPQRVKADPAQRGKVGVRHGIRSFVSAGTDRAWHLIEPGEARTVG